MACYQPAGLPRANESGGRSTEKKYPGAQSSKHLTSHGALDLSVRVDALMARPAACCMGNGR